MPRALWGSNGGGLFLMSEVPLYCSMVGTTISVLHQESRCIRALVSRRIFLFGTLPAGGVGVFHCSKHSRETWALLGEKMTNEGIPGAFFDPFLCNSFVA